MCVSCVCVPRRHPCFAATCELRVVPHARSSRRERAPGDRGARSRRGAGGPLLSRPPRWRVGRRDEWPRSRERVYLCRGRDPLTCAGKSQGLRGVCAERRPSSPGAAPPRCPRSNRGFATSGFPHCIGIFDGRHLYNSARIENCQNCSCGLMRGSLVFQRDMTHS